MILDECSYIKQKADSDGIGFRLISGNLRLIRCELLHHRQQPLLPLQPHSW